MKILEVLKESNGKFSMARVVGTFLVMVYGVSALYLTFSTKTLPDIPLGLAALIAALYGINRFSGSNAH